MLGRIDQAQHRTAFIGSVIRVERHNRGVFDELHIDQRGLGTGYRVFRGIEPTRGIALQPGAHRGKAIEIAFDFQGFQCLIEGQ